MNGAVPTCAPEIAVLRRTTSTPKSLPSVPSNAHPDEHDAEYGEVGFSEESDAKSTAASDVATRFCEAAHRFSPPSPVVVPN